MNDNLTFHKKIPVNEAAGLYLHIPFCKKKCRYCDFYSITGTSLVDRFTTAVKKEMKQVGRNCGLCFDTLYIGGGTPSLLPPKAIRGLIESAWRYFTFLSDTEITIEINPGTIDSDGLKEYKSAGINRLSIGAQSFHSSTLEFLGRIHSAKESSAAILHARSAGFTNIGIDLIYGVPGQSSASWAIDLKKTVEFTPEHLSCYMLTYEDGTPLHADLKNNRFHPMEERAVCDLFEATLNILGNFGYEQYEISNFSRCSGEDKTSFRSRHNQKYWSFAPYIGLGPSAHSFIPPKRYWNSKNVSSYLDTIDREVSPVGGEEVLSRDQQLIETIYIGLRKKEGISVDRLNETFHMDFEKVYHSVLTDLKRGEYLQLLQGRCSLTSKGMLFLDSIASRLICHEGEKNH